MFISNLSIGNFRCFSSATMDGIGVPDGTPGSGMNVLIGENGTGKTTVLEAINFVTDSSFAVENRLSIHDFADVAQPIEVAYRASSAFECDMPPLYRGCFFEADGIEVSIKPRSRKAPNRPLSSPYSVTHSFRPTGSAYKKKDGSDSGSLDPYHLTLNQATWRDEALGIFLFDKNRGRHLTRGNYRTTFERVCDDLNWRFVNELNKDASKRVELENGTAEGYLALASKIAGSEVGKQTAADLAELLDDAKYSDLRLDLADFLNPFDDARLVLRRDGELPQIAAKDLGSGIEVMTALLMLKSIASASKGKLVYLIDEPEAHLHPRAQQSLARLLVDESADKQIFLATHSPYMFKDVLNASPGLFTLVREGDRVSIKNAGEIGQRVLPWGPTWGEINYRAYGLPTVELHNELYGYLQEATGNFTERAIEEHLASLGVERDCRWIRSDNGSPEAAHGVTLPTFVRHSIHHPENNFNADLQPADLAASTEVLIEAVGKLDAS